MKYLLKRHPLEMQAHLMRSLVLCYSAPTAALESLLLPGLSLDTHGESGFVVVAMVETQAMRPNLVPKGLGGCFFLAGYRLFVRYRTQAGKRLRGLQVLRSETDNRWLLRTGNLLTHYRYVRVEPEFTREERTYRVLVRRGNETVLDVTADLAASILPSGSIFSDSKEARRFAGPMPFTFSYEPETNSVIRVEGVREEWTPQMVGVEIEKGPNFEELGISQDLPKLASAFYLENVPYRWKKGIVERIA